MPSVARTRVASRARRVVRRRRRIVNGYDFVVGGDYCKVLWLIDWKLSAAEETEGLRMETGRLERSECTG